ncbi:MAG: hypothetical protein LBR36_09480, partial [Bacteroidales bacterium]|nr:hypothetical protein [Bacteroidales bacterium]
MKRTDFLQKVAVLVLLLGMMININVNAQLIRYVYPGGRGTQTGDKWDNASPDLQAMIDTVETKGGGEVWV